MDPRNYLPHRPPFLMVDRIVEIDAGRRAVAIKRLDPDDPVFAGHFPGLPIFPGVLQIECMAQTSGLCVVDPRGEPSIGLLAAVEKARFYQPAVPGDELRIEAVVTTARRQLVKAEAAVYRGEEKLSSAAITFVLRSRAALGVGGDD